MSETAFCDDKEQLVAYLYDEIDGIVRRRVDEHLRVCPSCAAELAGLPRTSSSYVFPGRDLSKPMTDAKRRFKLALKRAGLPAETTIHDLRRSMGVALAHSGYSAEAIAAVLRNTSNVAAKHYITIAASHVIEATDKAATAILGRT